MNILSLRYMKWVPNLGAILRVAVLAIFAILVVVAGIQHGFQGSISNGFFPGNAAVFVGVIGVLVFQWIGFELQTNASEEMENPQRDVPRAVAASGIISFLSYAIPIAGVILVLSSKQLTNVGSFVTGYQTVVSSTLGGGATAFNYIVGAILVFSLLSSGTTWLMGADRMMAIGALAGSGPRQLGYFSARFGTPVPVNVLSGILSTIFMVLTFSITSGNLFSFYAVVLSLAISTTTFSYILVFPALITLRQKYPNQPRPYRVPFGVAGAWMTMVLCELYVILATVFSLWPSICSTTSGKCFGSDAVGQVSGLDRGPYELTVLVTIGVMIVIGIVFWSIGRGHAVHIGPPQMQPQAMPATGD
jgi:amino acid transporter